MIRNTCGKIFRIVRRQKRSLLASLVIVSAILIVCGVVFNIIQILNFNKQNRQHIALINTLGEELVQYNRTLHDNDHIVSINMADVYNIISKMDRAKELGLEKHYCSFITYDYLRFRLESIVNRNSMYKKNHNMVELIDKVSDNKDDK